MRGGNKRKRTSFSEKSVTLPDLRDGLTEEVRRTVELYEKALAAWERANFAEARELLEELVNENLDMGDLEADGPTEVLLDRIRKYFTADDGQVVTLSPEELARWD